MRFEVKKFLFMGPADEKARFFKKAQLKGFIFFIAAGDTQVSQEIPQEVQETTNAIKVLRHMPIVEQEENHKLIGHLESVVKDILRLNEENEALLEKLRVLSIEIERIDVFGDFSLEDIDYIEKEGKRKVQFFCARPSLYEEEPIPPELIFIASEHNLDYYVAINPHSVQYEKMIELKIDQPLGVLKKRYAEAQHKQRETEHRIKEYAIYNDLLHHFLLLQLDKHHLKNAETYVQQTMEGTLFAVEGWVPDNQIKRLPDLIDGMHIYSEEIAIEPDEVVPTYLENEGFSRLGEDLVSIYDTPSSTDKDPSLWVLGSFTLFFAFIIADAGYGFIYLALALFLKFKYPNLKGMGKRMINLFIVLAVGCIVWGTLIVSFFGIEFPFDSPIRKVSLLDWVIEKKAAYHLKHQDETYKEWVTEYPEIATLKETKDILKFIPSNSIDLKPIIYRGLSDNIMFEVALFIGVIHLALSLLRYIRRNWQGAGWLAFLFGSYLYFATYLNAPSLLNYIGGIDLVRGGAIGLQLMIGGVVFAVVASVIRHGIVGVFEVMTVVQIFADVLSYLRLYALGLAGIIVAETIDEVAGLMPLVIGIFLMLISHFINIILCTMSGVIHGLRLNFIEWYHYSFEGGGKLFKPLKLLSKK